MSQQSEETRAAFEKAGQVLNDAGMHFSVMVGIVGGATGISSKMGFHGPDNAPFPVQEAIMCKAIQTVLLNMLTEGMKPHPIGVCQGCDALRESFRLIFGERA